MSVTCPQGHPSDDAEWCTVCGALIGGAPIALSDAEPSPPTPATAPSPSAEATAEPCPRCATPRFGDDQFCEQCGFDFLDPDDPDGHVATVPIDDERPTWHALVSADRDQYDRTTPEDLVFPSTLADRVVALDGDCIRIGRRSEARGAHPEIDLAGPPEDTGVSRFHADLNRQSDGSYAIVDTGSANGTTLNDATTLLVEGVAHPLHHGDRIHLGAWTTITILQNPEPD